MKLTVLGSSASYAGPGQACSGHLVQSGGTSVLLDCGNGVVSNLAQVLDPLKLDAVVISHEHVDHLADLFALQALLRYAPSGPAAPMRLFAPSGLLERMACLLSESGSQQLSEAFDAHDLVSLSSAEVGDLCITPHRVDHIDPTFALMVEDMPSGRCLCYTSDTSQGRQVEAAARGVHLLLAEATLPHEYAGRVAHMTAGEAGALATRVEAERLVLTHIWPTTNRETIVREAIREFAGPVAAASEFDSFSV